VSTWSRSPALSTVTGFRDPQLTGTWREEHQFVLKQALALFDFYMAQLSECDAQIEHAFAVIKPRFDPAPAAPVPVEAATPPRRKPHSHSKNAPAVNTRAHILRITGVDLAAVHGSSDSLAHTILAEIGSDMQKWPDAKTSAPGLG
jgi:transposase